MTLIEHIHAQHEKRERTDPTWRPDPACLLCVEAQARKPEWVLRLPKLARELGTRRALA